MVELLQNFHFIRPLWLLMLLPVVALLLFLWRDKSSVAQWQRFMDVRFIDALTIGKRGKPRLLELLLLATIWLMAALALAGPTWVKIVAPITKNETTTVILLDLSPSMLSEDVKPSRLVRARHKLSDFLDKKNDGLTALIAYSGDAHIVTPPTDDIRTIKNLLNALHPNMMPAKGSNIEEALQFATDILARSTEGSGNILVLTDGIDQQAEANIFDIEDIKNNNIGIWSVGTESGAPIPVGDGTFAKDARGNIIVAKINSPYLSELATKLRGQYIPYSANSTDLKLAEHILNNTVTSNNDSAQSQREFDDWEEFGRYLLLPLAILFAFAFRKGWAVPALLLAGVISQPQTVFSLPLPSPLLTEDQRAEKAYKQGDLEQAAEQFTSPEWKAAAQYKNGQFEQAEQIYSQQNGNADFAYNLGNTFAMQKKYKEAIDAYDQAIKNNPSNANAINNKRIIEDLLEKLKEQEQQQGQDGDQSDDQNDSGDNTNDQSNSDSSDPNDSASNNPDNNVENNQQDDNQEQNQDQDQEQADGDESESPEQDQNESQANDEQQQALDDHYNDSEDKANEQDGEQENDQEDSSENNQAEASSENPERAESEQEDGDTEAQDALAESFEPHSEEQQELDQWLRKVPDDPSRLMRNKFLHQYRQKQREGATKSWRSTPDTKQRW